jgi:hypothetical protein
MPITPFHLAAEYGVYSLFVKLKIIKKGDYAPLWMMFSSNLIDLDHLFRLFSAESPIKQEYGLNNLFFHGWWMVLPISLLSMSKKYCWFGLGLAIHITLDGLMVFFGLNSFLMPII